MTDPTTQTFQFFTTPDLATTQGYFQPDGSQILQWGPKEYPNGVPSTWSPEYRALDKSKPGDWWDNPNNPKAEKKPGGRVEPEQPAAKPKLAPAPFKGNKTQGHLYTSPVTPTVRAAPAKEERAAPPTPNAALDALLEAEKTPWYERVWNGTAAAYENAVNNVSAGFDAPLEAGKGFVKGVVNMFTSDVWNLAVTAGQMTSGMSLALDLMDAQALRLEREGDIAQANQLADFVARARATGHVGPLWKPSTPAEEGGAVFSIVFPVGAVAGGVSKIAKLARGATTVEDLSKIAATTADAQRAAKAEQAAQTAGKVEDGAGGAAIEKKGAAFGEKSVNDMMTSKGYERIDTGGEYKAGITGIDSIWHDPKTGLLFVVDAKYGSASLGKTVESYEGIFVKQMSDPWIESRLAKAFGGDNVMAKIFNQEMAAGRVLRVVGKVSPDGSVVFELIDAAGRKVKNVEAWLPHG